MEIIIYILYFFFFEYDIFVLIPKESNFLPLIDFLNQNQ